MAEETHGAGTRSTTSRRGGDGRTSRRRDHPEELPRTIGTKERRKERARRRRDRTLLFGMGMFGLVGWSVALPTLAGLALGVWLDRRLPAPFSWTLTLLVAGVLAGCLNAWYWVSREGRVEPEETDEEERWHEGRRG